MLFKKQSEIMYNLIIKVFISIPRCIILLEVLKVNMACLWYRTKYIVLKQSQIE